MKKNIILYSFIALLSGTAGCSDMLDQYPLDAISPETYYNNADELRSATNQFYGMFPGAASGYTESADVYRPKYKAYAPYPHLAEAGTGNTSELSISI